MMKKLLALVLALAMVMMVSAAFAATIEVQNVIDDETYTAYKILNYSDNGKTGEERSVSYYLTASEYASIGSVLEAAGFEFTASADGSQYTVSNAEDFDAAAAAAYLGEHAADLGSALGTATATGEGGSATFTDLPTGYYFVTSSAGSLCALHEDSDIATAVEKNTIPSLDKKQSASDENYADAQLDLNIGDKVYYQVEITDGTGTDKEIVLVDTLSAGLTFDGTSTITVTDANGTVESTNYTVSEATDSGFTLTLSADYVASLAKDAVVTVKYTATINKNAVINGENTNKVELTYSAQTMEDSTVVKTYDFIVYKTDGTDFLDGAEFKLYDAATGGNQILLSKDDTGYYKDASGSADTTIDINSADGCNVRGLEPGTYYLEEVVVPDGYNKLAARESVTVAKDQTGAAEITVVNNAGTELPSTGGMGTTIFYVVGGLLIIGAAVILVARRKAHD